MALRSAASAVGNTPLIRIDSLSDRLGCDIYGKGEYMNPGGSVKDRPALRMILEAEKNGELVRGEPGTIVEATGGNTGIALALIGQSLGYNVCLTMVETLSKEKVTFMQTLGAEVVLCPKGPWGGADHYFTVAQRIRDERHAAGERVVFTNQFDNNANTQAHIDTTGPEIAAQLAALGMRLDGFVTASGTAGTISGLASYIKGEAAPAHVKDAVVGCVDCQGSAMFSYLSSRGESLATEGGSVAEGIGKTDVTGNFKRGERCIDAALRGSDAEAYDMAKYLMRHDGIFLGPSGALNVVGAAKLARLLGPGHTIVTILCDSGERYLSSFHNAQAMAAKGFDTAPAPPLAPAQPAATDAPPTALKNKLAGWRRRPENAGADGTLLCGIAETEAFTTRTADGAPRDGLLFLR
eukprot:TRINITY_DN8544_c0_g1_i1.p1 TRINITY_DN8544_c0_g1~~TRINITY_DN8544_c0_g1_i1.p1  ORF type:complete len:409 (+),score=88.86 TRINITY_DN8544_c0_g1_i1:104-1330(+)